MANKKLGRQTVALQDPPSVIGSAAVVGKKEGEGPLAATFDHISQDDSFGERSWEKAESAMQKMALAAALSKAGLSVSGLDYLLAGDLLNQCIGSALPSGGRMCPSSGCTGPVPPWRSSLSLAAMLLDGGCGTKIAAMTSSISAPPSGSTAPPWNTAASAPPPPSGR